MKDQATHRDRRSGPPPGCFDEWLRVDTPAVDPRAHTMPSDVLEKYVTDTKLSPEQRGLVEDALRHGNRIEVHGIYDRWAALFLNQRGLRVTQGPFERFAPGRGTKRKDYNYLRPTAMELADGSGGRAVFFFVFPSHEYVHQYAEVIATYVAITKEKLGIGYDVPVQRIHY
ncbi:MAG TPA: hypothetical protein VK665_13920, partial [Candidatus Elarobacter sp.]|nr:hypothetical protein [Candidatus Elarobacter sp.]